MPPAKSSFTRRTFIAGASLSLMAAPARASEFAYKGWRFDTDAVHGPLPDEVIGSFHAQIDIVESLTIKPDITDFFRHVSVRVESSAAGYDAAYRSRDSRKTRTASFHRIFLSARTVPPDNPVFLRTLLIAYLDERVANGWRDTQLAGYLDDAKRSGAFPNRSEMLRATEDFFAACTSVVLWGRSAREPLRRAKVRETLPAFYGWIVREFYPAGGGPADAS